MEKIQLIFFFISGFLVSRLLIKAKLPHRIVYWFIGKRHLSISKIVFFLIIISAFLSFFIPNAITVLTLLPLLELLRRSYAKSSGSTKGVATLLALATIYGANIGGMGSVTATPANGILVTYAVLNRVPGIQHITFASWLVWGVPLVVVFTIVAWLVLTTGLRTWRYQKNKVELAFHVGDVNHPYQSLSIWITVVYFLSSFALSLVLMSWPQRTPLILTITGCFTLGLAAFLFFIPVKGGKKYASKQALLSISDCYNELPTRGFIFVGIAVVLATILYALKFHEFFSQWAVMIIPTDLSVFTLLLFIALATSFSTELLSNTAVQLSFFIIALPLSQTHGISGLNPLIIITLACTSAFMSPIATGVNGLAFGGVRGVSFLKMLIVGFVMNVAGALLLSTWTFFIIGGLYRLN